MDFYISQLQSITFWGNTLWDYTLAASVFVASLIALKIFQLILLSRLKKLAKITSTDLDDAFISVISKIHAFFYIVVALYVGVRMLTLPEQVMRVIHILFLLVVAHQVIKGIGEMMDFGIKKYSAVEEDEQQRKHTAGMAKIMRGFVVITLWAVVLLFLLSNFGVDITSVVAGLGIGGLAIALAVQNILSDVFSSFSIFVDKPFEVGHFIQVGTDSGTVEKIGLKTTRLKTMRGEELVISNKELTSARLQNFKKLTRRRDVIPFGVVYGLTQTSLKKIPTIAKKVCSKIDHVEFDRCNMNGFGDSSLDWELVYYMDTNDFKTFVNAKQNILLGLYTQFAKEDIDFAYPTQVMYLEKSDL